MPEIDLFERSLAGALLRMADCVPGAVDATAVAHRVVLEHPRRLTTVVRWRVTAPRWAWALLLLAGLFASLVAGALLAGSQPEQRLPAVVPPVGQGFECPPGSTPDKPGPVDQARPPRDLVEAMAFDRRSGRIVLVGTETWTFDVCTNTWTRMNPSQSPDTTVAWNPMVYDVDSDVTVALGSGPVWAYDLEADSWLEKAVPPVGAQLLFYDPVSGHVVARADAWGLWDYDVGTDTWTPIRQEARPVASEGGVDFFAYDRSLDRLVLYTNHTLSGTKTWRFIRTSIWSQTRALAPRWGSWIEGQGMPSIAHDEAARRPVISGGNAGLVAYDPTANRWEVLVGPGAPVPSASWVVIVYDPVNERLVGRGLDEKQEPDGSFVDVDDVVAFDLLSGEWTVLLGERPGRNR